MKKPFAAKIHTSHSPMVSLSAFILFVLVLLVLASCNGGGGGSPTPSPTPSPPTPAPGGDEGDDMTVMPPVPPMPSGQPDLFIESTSVNDNTLTPGQQFTLRVTIRNRGDVRAAATTLRYKTHSQLPIIPDDPTVGTDSVRSLVPSATVSETITLTAPSTSGIYYYGACVDSVSGESVTSNNCSGSRGAAVRVSSSGTPGGGSGSFYSYYAVFTDGGHTWAGWSGRTQAEAERNAANACRSLAGTACTRRITYGTGFTHQCGALALGTDSEGRVNVDHGGSGTTQSAAQRDAIIRCRNIGGMNCRIASSRDGAAASGCVR